MIRGVHHIAINCRDIDRMMRFYCEAFGFEPVEGDDFVWADQPTIDYLIDVPASKAKSHMLRAGQCYLEMFEYAQPAPRVVEPLRPFDRGYTHFCVDVTDIENDIEHLKACGMTFNDRDVVDAGIVKALYGYDPEGNVVEVQQCAPDNGFTLEELKSKAGAK